MVPSIEVAVMHHQNGALDLAEASYRAILAAHPHEVNAKHFLGMLLVGRGQSEEGLVYLQESIALQAESWIFLNNLGVIYTDLGQLDDAIETLRKAMGLNNSSSEVINNLARAQSLLGQHDEAITNYHRSLALSPKNVKTLSSLSCAYLSTQQWKHAEKYSREAIQLDARLPEAHLTLGATLFEQGDLRQSIAALVVATELAPNNVTALNALAASLTAAGRLQEAESYTKAALAIAPDSATTKAILASIYCRTRRYSAALQLLEQVELEMPDDFGVLSNIAQCLHGLAQVDEAIRYFRRAIAIRNCPAFIFSNYLMTLLYSESITAEEIWMEHQKFSQRFEENRRPNPRRFRNNLDHNRKLRIGFVSGDLRDHPVSYLVEPILRNIDRTRFELFAYHNHAVEDSVSTRLRTLFDHWLPCGLMPDADLAHRIEIDMIDVLFDLSGHTAYNRLLVFARKPAPVQITWVGYPGTTGLTSMDYRITHADLDPVGLADSHHSEMLIRLQGRDVAFAPVADAPPVGELPCLRTGVVTFACLNNPAKIGTIAVKTWSLILKRVPNSRLILSIGADPRLANHLTGMFASFGIGIDRLVLEQWRDMHLYLALHNDIDIGLDPFPYNGGTSTFHSLFMGVPVITLAGDHTVSRVGVSILAPLGLDAFVAQSEIEYVERAVSLAADVSSLKEVRALLRGKLLQDHQSNEAAVAKELERAIRSTWVKWCESCQEHQSQ